MKKIAPVLITIIFAGYIMLIISGILFEGYGEEPKLIIIFLSIGAFSLLMAMIYTLIKRLIEIDKENDDDISKY